MRSQPLWLQAVDRTGQFNSSQWCPTIVVIFGVHHGTCWMFTRSSLTEKLIDLETSSHCEKSWATMRHTNDIEHSTYISWAFANVGKFKNLQANTAFWLFARTERRTKNTVSTEPSNISKYSFWTAVQLCWCNGGDPLHKLFNICWRFWDHRSNLTLGCSWHFFRINFWISKALRA